jgi:1-acyl-sn-glycerol-3-phosphate acyltransferase
VPKGHTLPAPVAPVPFGTSELESTTDRVVELVRELAQETGGSRAAGAASAEASLEREVGLGSLERVELLLRLESAFGRSLDDRCLGLDTARDLARSVLEGGPAPERRPPPRAPAVQTAAADVLGGVETIHAALWHRARAEPDRPTVHMREEDGREHTITYGQLWREAATIAGGLREHGVRPRDTVALMLPTGMDFLRSFQGILTAGAIPVPIYPPARLDRLEEYAVRQSAILADAGVKLLITVARARPIAALLRPSVESLAAVTTADELAGLHASWSAPEGRGGDPAFIQYTSGSTGRPKGVLLTQDNLLANIAAIGAGIDVRPTDVGASWLPLYHDMGLIGTWLFCLVQGLPVSIQSPLAFLSRPERWLWTIHERRATLSPAPNFAFELCARRIPDAALQGLDLSSWRCALNGAEPVNPDTIERFVARFAPHGFRREAMLPVYGLAECSVALTFAPLGRSPRVERIAREPFAREGRALPAPEDDASALRFVSVGTALPRHEVRLVDDRGDAVPERTVGRLAFRGPSSTPGYFNKAEATAAMTLPGGFLDSGDLAYEAEGEIFITGRKKDLIIKGGRNLVPQEIEEAAASVPGIRKGCVVAFGVTHAASGTESLVIVAETRAKDAAARERLIAAVTDRVSAVVDVPPDVVALVPPGAVLKTSSGKVRRAATRELFEGGRLGQRPRTTLGQRLRLGAAVLSQAILPSLRALRRAAYVLWIALAMPLVAVPCWALIAIVPSRRLAFVLGRVTVRWILRVCGCRVSVSGLQNLAEGGPFLLTSNHTSYSDIPTLMAVLPMDFLFAAKREALSYPIVGTYLRRCGHLTVERFDAQQSVADAERFPRAIREGRSVLVFPEGTFTAAVGLRPFRLGAFKTAVETKTPIVPMTLRGTRQVMRGTWLIPRPGRIELWIGSPTAPEGDDWRAVVSLRDRVAEAIAARCGEPRLDLVAGGPERPSGP